MNQWQLEAQENAYEQIIVGFVFTINFVSERGGIYLGHSNKMDNSNVVQLNFYWY